MPVNAMAFLSGLCEARRARKFKGFFANVHSPILRRTHGYSTRDRLNCSTYRRMLSGFPLQNLPTIPSVSSVLKATSALVMLGRKSKFMD